VQITDRDGTVAFACAEVEAPIDWSNLAVAVVARRYFASEPEERSVRALIERVVEAIAGWAQDAGHIRRQRTPVISHARSPARWCDRRTPRTTAYRSFARSRLRRSRNSSAQRLKRILGRLPAPAHSRRERECRWLCGSGAAGRFGGRSLAETLTL
jgi:hypothetical protein